MIYVYKFRVLTDQDENFIRDIDIKSSQTFLDLHKIMLECVKISGNELSSFFLTNSEWEKQKEFTLMDMMQEMPDIEGTGQPPVFVMEKEKLCDHIEDPHQRMLFEYDFLNPQVFFLELTEIQKGAQKGKNYPYVSFSQGDCPKDANSMQTTDLRELESLRNKDIDTNINDIDRFLKEHYSDLYSPDKN